MSAPVDVLAAIRALAANVEFASLKREADEAITTVAELIGYMKQVRIEATESPQTDADRLAAIAALADVALARVQGGAA